NNDASRNNGGAFRKWKTVRPRSNEKPPSICCRKSKTCTRRAGFFSNSARSTICHVAGCRRGKERSGAGISGSHSIGKSEIQATVVGVSDMLARTDGSGRAKELQHKTNADRNESCHINWDKPIAPFSQPSLSSCPLSHCLAACLR